MPVSDSPPSEPVDPVILSAPFDPSLDIDKVTSETRVVADGLRRTFGLCTVGHTDLHILERARVGNVEGLCCRKCETVFIHFVVREAE